MKSVSRPASDTARTNFDLSHLYHLLLSKAWIIILFVILSVGAAIGYILWAPKIYESTAVIEVGQETPRVNNIQDFDTNTAANSSDLLKTLEQALLSDTLLLRVVKA